MHLKHGWIRFGCMKQLHLLVVLGRVGLGQSADVLGWIGSHKMGPRTTLVRYTSICRRIRSPGAVLRSWMATKSVPCSSLGRQLPTSLANARVSFADSAKEQFSYRFTVTWRCVISQAPATADFFARQSLRCIPSSTLRSTLITLVLDVTSYELPPGKDAIANESAPIQLAQCRFPGLVISNAV